MQNGTTHAESLARANPLDHLGLKQAAIKFAFKYRSVLLCSCMHIALWMQLDLLPACCVILAQYQTHRVHLHFATLKHLVGYLRLNPDVPLAFDRTCFQDQEISVINLEISNAPPIDTLCYSPDGYHIASVDLLLHTHDFSA
jgi:hypothetical protein